MKKTEIRLANKEKCCYTDEVKSVLKNTNGTVVSCALVIDYYDALKALISLQGRNAFIFLGEQMMKKQNPLMKLILAAMFLALAYVMPFLTGQIPQIGAKLCPMHIPVLLCGYICGWPWGLVVGFLAPLLRSLTLSMPPLYPTAVCMAFELAVYGTAAGLLYEKLPKRKPFIFVSLIVAMLAGRFVWGGAMAVCTGLQDAAFGWSAFFAGAFVNAVPGIVVQIVLVPVIVMLAEKFLLNTKRL